MDAGPTLPDEENDDAHQTLGPVARAEYLPVVREALDQIVFAALGCRHASTVDGWSAVQFCCPGFPADHSAFSSSRKTATAPSRARACSSSDAAAAAACSTNAAFCWVALSICVTARLIWSMPRDCSSEATLISLTMPV